MCVAKVMYSVSREKAHQKSRGREATEYEKLFYYAYQHNTYAPCLPYLTMEIKRRWWRTKTQRGCLASEEIHAWMNSFDVDTALFSSAKKRAPTRRWKRNLSHK